MQHDVLPLPFPNRVFRSTTQATTRPTEILAIVRERAKLLIFPLVTLLALNSQTTTPRAEHMAVVI
jgi:hypothetical protein